MTLINCILILLISTISFSADIAPREVTPATVPGTPDLVTIPIINPRSVASQEFTSEGLQEIQRKHAELSAKYQTKRLHQSFISVGEDNSDLRLIHAAANDIANYQRILNEKKHKDKLKTKGSK